MKILRWLITLMIIVIPHGAWAQTQTYVDPNEQAFTMEVPAGWQVEGGTHHTDSGAYYATLVGSSDTGIFSIDGPYYGTGGDAPDAATFFGDLCSKGGSYREVALIGSHLENGNPILDITDSEHKLKGHAVVLFTHTADAWTATVIMTMAISGHQDEADAAAAAAFQSMRRNPQWRPQHAQAGGGAQSVSAR